MPSKPAPAEDFENKDIEEEKLAGDEASRAKVFAPAKTRRDSIISFLAQFAVVAVLFFAIGFVTGQKKIQIDNRAIIPRITVTNQANPKDVTVDFSLFWDVFQSIPQKYVDKSAIDPQKMVYGAIAGMVKSLGDPYTAFLDPTQNDSVKAQISGTYQGVGIQLGFNKDLRIAVIAPLKDSPADKAGVLAKDLILKINDAETVDMTLPEAVNLIRGDAGTSVKLEFLREGEDKPIEKTLVRARIDVKSVLVDYKKTESGKQIAVLAVGTFGEKTDSEWDSAVGEILSKKVDGVIVDMRNNPGGLLASAQHLAGEFVQGTVVKQEFSDGSQTSLPADHVGKLLKMPVVVLVNGGSASAAEIFSGAVQDYGRGKLVGEKTFGKGTVQDVVDFPGGAGLHVTIAKWLTPKGNSIHHVGITPDITVELKQEDRDAKRDPQMDKALGLF